MEPGEDILDQTEPFGTIVSVTGSRAIATMEDRPGALAHDRPGRLAVGRLALSEVGDSIAVGVVAALTTPMPELDSEGANMPLVEVELLGEIINDPVRGKRFHRGLTAYPTIGDPVRRASNADLELIYRSDSKFMVDVGRLSLATDLDSPADVKKLVTSHFAFVGATGVGKSCGMVLLLKAIIERFPDFRIFIIDPHNEYKDCFGERTVTMTPATMNLPFWLFNFEEIVDVFFLGRPGVEAEVELLREIIPIAKNRYYANQARSKANLLRRPQDKLITFNVDAPVPYRISDLIGIIDERSGKLESRGDIAMLRRLKSRIETVSQDPRCTFMFGQLTIEDTMVDVLGQLFRVPDHGRPISVVELAGMPAEVVDAVVSVLCRLAFDFGLWSEGAFPILVVCEEAHRYVPAQMGRGFGPTRRAISRIAKEGRKYGLYLGLASQRPAELDPTILSQCGTVFAMRLSNDRDQEILRATVPDALSSQLDFLPAMGPREALAIGEAVTLPMRLRFNELERASLPRSHARPIDAVAPTQSPEFIKEVVDRWRASATHMTELAESLPGIVPQPPGNGPGQQDIPPSYRPPGEGPAPGPAPRKGSGEPAAPTTRRIDWQALRDLSRR